MEGTLAFLFERAFEGTKPYLPLYDINGSPINRGGTYDCIMKSKEMGLEEGDDIFVIKCTRK